MPKRTLRNMRTLIRKYPLWVAIATGILAAMLGWGLPMISYDFHSGILITVIGILISVPFFLRAYQLYAHLHFKTKTWVILTTILIVGIALIATQLQFTQTRPKLRVDFAYSSFTASTGEIALCILNNGQSTAYQYRPILFVAPVNQLTTVDKAIELPGTNFIEPNESKFYLTTINQTDPAQDVWYLYFKLIYSDSPTGGHLYADDSPYWLSFDFNDGLNGYEFHDLTPAQRDIFEAAIKVSYPDEDFK